MSFDPARASTVLVTGANRGIGLELARQYLADGWHVIATCRKPETALALQDLHEKCGEPLRIEALDVLDSSQIASLSKRLVGVKLDVLLNNAGIISGAGGAEPDLSQKWGTIDPVAWDLVLRTNTIAPVMITQALLPLLLAGEQKKVVMISSMMGSLALGKPNDIAYRTSKAALNMAMRTIRSDLAAQNVSITCFHPGWVRTDMGGPDGEISVEQSAKGLREQIGLMNLSSTGSFLGYDGAVWAW